MTERYRSLKCTCQGVYKEKGSKFIGLAYPILDESEVKPILEQLRKEHPGAVHFCYAWRLGADGSHYRANDDGEPSGSAGKPIHNQLLSFEITNTLLVVVRYYGGTKLGVSGLISAYKEAAQQALETAEIEERVVSDYFELSFGYEQIGDVNRVLRERKLEPNSKRFEHSCWYQVLIPVTESTGFTELFEGIEGVCIKYCGRY